MYAIGYSLNNLYYLAGSSAGSGGPQECSGQKHGDSDARLHGAYLGARHREPSASDSDRSLGDLQRSSSVEGGPKFGGTDPDPGVVEAISSRNGGSDPGRKPHEGLGDGRRAHFADYASFVKTRT